MERLTKFIIFFVGWALSPFTWWNDAFVNMPLSYLLASLTHCFIRLPFLWLVLFCYWLTNIAGLLFMYLGGRDVIALSRSKKRATACMLLFIILYSLGWVYIDRKGRLLPLGEAIERYCIHTEMKSK